MLHVKMLNLTDRSQRGREHNIINYGAFGDIVEIPYKDGLVVGKRI